MKVELEMINNDKKKYFIIIGVLILAIAGWFVFGRSHVHDNGNRIDGARQQLDNVAGEQQQAIDGVTNIESGLNDSTKSVDGISDEIGSVSAGIGDTQNTIADAQNRISGSQTTLTDSASLIADCQRILRQVRERGQTGTN